MLKKGLDGSLRSTTAPYSSERRRLCFSDEEFDDVEDKDTYKSMLTRDERRFKNADRDKDGIATREEFTAFLHPEEFDHMRDVVVQVGVGY